MLFLATLTVAAAVSVTGLISFIGLLAPHTARLLTGHNRRSSCLLSGIIGSVLLLTADVLAKSLTAVELPVSIFTSLLGAPFLIYLILSERRSESKWLIFFLFRISPSVSADGRSWIMSPFLLTHQGV